MKEHIKDLGDGCTLRPMPASPDQTLPSCPNGCIGEMALVANGFCLGVNVLTAGCYNCRGLWDTVDGKITRKVSD